MKDKKQIELTIGLKRFYRRLKSKEKRKRRRRVQHLHHIYTLSRTGGDISYENLVKEFLPINIGYLLSCEKSDFFIDKLLKLKINNDGDFLVPAEFSIIDFPKESYRFIQEVTAALILQKYQIININYKNCIRADLGAQVLLDIILKDIITFFKTLRQIKPKYAQVKEINGTNFKNDAIKKLLFSVGSPAIHMNKTVYFKDIIPYKLCIHDRESHIDPIKIIEKKDIDTTTLVDYVIECLKRLNKKLTPEKLDNLCVVISEILINAEEHSSTKYRFSIGYFHEIQEDGKHYGVFRLAILNFGNTIYEKFKAPGCPNTNIVTKMKILSDSYNKRNIFFQKQFEEETLWTLYSLQEGVTTVAPDKYRKRGNGSIQFIESFFNIKGEEENIDEISRLAILSGNTSIIFDGKYKIHEKVSNGEKFKYMTFNNSQNIEEKPDPKYVKFVEDYFPGTIISAKILFNDDDFTK